MVSALKAYILAIRLLIKIRKAVITILNTIVVISESLPKY